MTRLVLLVDVQPPEAWTRQVSELTNARFEACRCSPAHAAEDFRRACRGALPALALAPLELVPALTAPAAAFGVSVLAAEDFDARLQQQVAGALDETPVFPADQMAGPLLQALGPPPQYISLVDSARESVQEAVSRCLPKGVVLQSSDRLSHAALVLRPLIADAMSEHLLRAAHGCLLPRGQVAAFIVSGASPMAVADWGDQQWTLPREGFLPASPVCGFALNGLRVALSRTHWEVVSIKGDARCFGALSYPGWTVILRSASMTGGEYAQSRRARRAQAQRLNARGEELWHDGKAMAAATAFEKAVAVWNRDAASFNNLGVAYFAEGRFEEAVARFTDALHLDPCHPAARDNLIMAARATGKNDEAEKLLALFPVRVYDQGECEH